MTKFLSVFLSSNKHLSTLDSHRMYLRKTYRQEEENSFLVASRFYNKEALLEDAIDKSLVLEFLLLIRN